MEEHKKLVAVIQSVHRTLRRNYKKDPTNIANIWNEHCKNTSNLEEYAQAMHQLATVHWKLDESSSRITWCVDTCREYYLNGGLIRALRRDERISQAIKVPVSTNDTLLSSFPVPSVPLDLLDVGSCYNPFKSYSEFRCTAIDLHPAAEGVLKCDFLKLVVTSISQDQVPTSSSENPQLSSENEETTSSLDERSFDVVVFSLFLEYLPSPEQRCQACLKAHRLLRNQGLLLIISPDSKHANYNSHLVKLWKCTLDKMGFSRYRYDKLTHVHCMAFRKCQSETTVITDDSLFNGLLIPQDLNSADIVIVKDQSNYTRAEDEDIAKAFNFLPDLQDL